MVVRNPAKPKIFKMLLHGKAIIFPTLKEKEVHLTKKLPLFQALLMAISQSLSLNCGQN